MANQGFDLNQLDLSDKETREYVQQNIDLSDPETKKWWEANTPKAEVPTPEQPHDLTDSFKLGTRNVLEGAGSLLDIVGAPVNTGINLLTGAKLSATPGRDLGDYVSDQLDLPTAQNDAERLIGKGVEYGTQGLMTAGAGNLIKGAQGTAGLIGTSLAETPIRDVLAGVGSGLAEEGLRQEGYGELAQVAGAVGGGIGTYAGLSALPKAANMAGKSLQEIKDFFSAKGYNISDEEAARAYEYYSRGGEEASIINNPEPEVAPPQPSAPESLDVPNPAALDDVGPISNAERMPEDTPVDPALEAEAAAFKPKQEPTADDVFGAKAPVEEEYVPSALEKEIADHTDALTNQWENAPEVQIYDHFDDAEGIDPGSLGVYDPESGQVLLNAKGIQKEVDFRNSKLKKGEEPITVQQMTNTVLFHEGLGHYGLAQKFRGDLDATLTKWFDSSTWFKREVNRWLENPKNKDAYKDENQIARAAEEVLAEASEKGVLPVKLMDELKNKIKDYARQIGINLEFSKREIETILAQAHQAVVSGKKHDVTGNGFRSMKSSYGESEGAVQGRAGRENKEGETSVINKVRSNRQIDDILDNADVERTKETWGEWQSDAERIKMTTKMAESMATGATPAELIAAQEHATKLANTIADLSHKAANQTLSPKEASLLAQHIRHLDKTSQAISDVIANAARLMNSRKMEIASDDTVAARLLRNMTASEIQSLATPEGARKFARKLVSEEKKAAILEKAVNVWGNILNFTRSLWSSFDLSAPFRQGRALAHTPEFWKNMPNMLKYWGNKGFYDMTMKSITERPTYAKMKQGGLAFTELGKDLSKREEAFMSTWAEKIPGVKASERAYNGYLNKLRADVFDSMYKKLDDAGVDFEKNPKALKDLAHFINNASGRGNIDLGKFAPTVAGVLFSPRLMASRMAMLNPKYYATLSPGVRAQAIKSAAAFATSSAIFATLLAKSGLVEVESDPRSSDFMKLKRGDTRYDMLGGFGQYVTLYSRLLTNAKKMGTGEVVKLGSRPGADDALDVIKDFVRNKFSPNMALLADYWTGENAIGEKFDPKKEAIKRFVPLIAQDFYKQMESEGAFDNGYLPPDLGKAAKGAFKAAPGVIGIGAQTYPTREGFDEFGRNFKDDMEDTPEILEVKRLQEGREETVLGSVGKRVMNRKLTDEEHNEYQKLSSKYVLEDLKEEMAIEGWSDLPDEEKIEIIKEITRDARRDAREELFGDQDEEEEVVE